MACKNGGLRKCVYSSPQKGVKPKSAWFHQFGSQCNEGEDGGLGNYTTAIIETEDGQLHVVDPDYVQFVVPTGANLNNE